MNESETKIFPATVDYSIGMMERIHQAIGLRDFINIDPNISIDIDKYITRERFSLDDNVRKVNLELASVFDREIKELAVKRLEAQGFIMENLGELIQFLIDNPSEVAKYSYIVALGERSRWEQFDSRVFAPAIKMAGTKRHFFLEVFTNPFDFRDRFYDANCRVLVSRASK